MLRPLLACCAAIALCLSAGCSSPDMPDARPLSATASAPPSPSTSASASPSLSASPTPSTSPTRPTAPVSPAGLPRTADGAVAFMQFWFAAVEYAYATGDTAIVKANSAPDCETCNRLTTDVDAQYSQGGSFRNITIMCDYIAPAPLEDFGAPISLQVTSTPGQRVSADGSVQSNIRPSPPTNTTFYAGWQNGRWVSVEVAKDES